MSPGPGTFLCGCRPEEKAGYSASIVQVAGGEAISFKRYDKEGFEICPEHGARLYGWNSSNIQHPGGQTLTNWKSMGSGKPLKGDFGGIEDKRIKPDDGAEILAERAARSNGGSNGHARKHRVKTGVPPKPGDGRKLLAYQRKIATK
jgi:hypothetical protein